MSPLNLTNLPANFTLHPLGLSIWLETGHDRLFVVNHGKEMSTVEVFDLVEGSQPQARWVASLKGADWQGIIAPNSIVAIVRACHYTTSHLRVPLVCYIVLPHPRPLPHSSNSCSTDVPVQPAPDLP